MSGKPLILIIDDEKDVCALLGNILTSEGYMVLTALDGMSGLKIAEEKKPDIVLLDLKMPKMDGLEVLRCIKRIDKNIVVIIMTGYGTIDTARIAMKLDAFDYITKPFDLNYVKAVVKDGLKLTLSALADQMKEKAILKNFRLQQARFTRLKHCQGIQARS